MQPQFITVRGHDYEFEDGVYHCLHSDYRIETTEVDTMRNGEHDTYEVPIAICNNTDPVCDETVLDLSPEDLYDEPDYDDRDEF